MRRAASVAVTLLAVLSAYVCTLTVEDVLVGHRINRPAIFLSILVAFALATFVAVLRDWLCPTRRSVYSAMGAGLLLLLWSLIPLCT